MDINEFYHDLQQQIEITANAESQFIENQFAEIFAGHVEDAGELDGFDNCYVKSRGIKVNGYFLDEADGVLNLITCDIRSSDNPESLTNTELTSQFRRLTTFFQKAYSGEIQDKLEETSNAYELADLIFHNRASLHRVRLFLFSNAKLMANHKPISDVQIDDVSLSHSIWDLSRLHRLATSRSEREDILLDLSEFGVQLPCLPGPDSDCQSWMSIIPGEFLARLYDLYGSRLLEQNVRNFLQLRSKVNKGIRTTLLHDPSMFLAYNNGISVTVEEIETVKDEQGTQITRLKNFQIVNGGQTTASIYSAWKKDKVNLDPISVQMKITQIDSANVTDIVPLISRYSNSQNKISEADFFSNHPFHQRIHEFSQRLWAPPIADAQTETKWFYERTRGQYLDQQAYLTPAAKRAFKLEYPRSQMFVKTDLAKYENSWSLKPHIVSLGAQKNFARFADDIARRWESDDSQFSELYFHELIARAILFKSVEKIVSAATWYSGGYRANIVTYSVAWLFHYLTNNRKSLDFEKIWKHQSLSPGLEKTVAKIAMHAHQWLTNTPPQISNVTEYAKREFCWKGFAEERIEPGDIAINDWTISTQTRDKRVSEAKKEQKVDGRINAQTDVVQRGPEYWATVLERSKDSDEVIEKEIGILKIAVQIPRKIPTERQSKVLLDVASKLLM